MVSISNIYGHGFNEEWIGKFQDLGFLIRSDISAFEGSQVLRFIDFIKGPAIEIIEVESEHDYLEFLPPGMVPYCPGISLMLSSTPKKSLQQYKNDFSFWKPYILHDNYDGGQMSYLNFETPIVKDTFIWLTNVDVPPPVKAKKVKHPNTVSGIVGIVFNLSIGNLSSLATLIGTMEKAESTEVQDIEIGGVKIWSIDQLNALPVSKKEFPLIALILQANSLDYFISNNIKFKEYSFFSKPALLIETNRQSWDIVVTTSKNKS